MQARKTSWKLTFTAWTIVLVVWGALMLTLDRDSLLLLYELGGRHQRGLIIVLGLLIALPVLLEAARNVPRLRRKWQSRRWQSLALRGATADGSQLGGSSHWRSWVPAATPRRFRGPTQPPTLTARELAIVEQGQLAVGRVEHHGELCSVRFEAPWGETIASLPLAAAGTTPRQGTRAPLLYEPHTSMGVAPTLVGLEFISPQPSDVRPSLAERPPRRRAPQRLLLPVCATLHPVERLSRHRSAEVGQLTLARGRVSLSLGDSEPIAVRLDQPLRVELSAFLRADGEAELNFVLESRTSSAYRAGKPVPLRLKTQLPQSRIDRKLPLAWVDACYLARADFDQLWLAIVEAADDSALTASVAL